MHVIVPLAGPDFVSPHGAIKALYKIHGRPLLQYALESRPWSKSISNYTFVLHDCEEARIFASDYLNRWYDECSIVYISKFSKGAAISSLAGISLTKEFDQPIVIDLADIIYRSDASIEAILSSNSDIGGVALSFQSNNPQYSYLRCADDNKVIESAEKRLISDQASAGTYIFRDSVIFLRAVAHALENHLDQTHNGLFYVCPLFNGVLAQGKEVILEPVFDIQDIKFIDP